MTLCPSGRSHEEIVPCLQNSLMAPTADFNQILSSTGSEAGRVPTSVGKSSRSKDDAAGRGDETVLPSCDGLEAVKLPGLEKPPLPALWLLFLVIIPPFTVALAEWRSQFGQLRDIAIPRSETNSDLPCGRDLPERMVRLRGMTCNNTASRGRAEFLGTVLPALGVFAVTALRPVTSS